MSSKRTWSLPLPVAPCATASAPVSLAISIWRSAIKGRAAYADASWRGRATRAKKLILLLRNRLRQTMAAPPC